MDVTKKDVPAAAILVAHAERRCLRHSPLGAFVCKRERRRSVRGIRQSKYAGFFTLVSRNCWFCMLEPVFRVDSRNEKATELVGLAFEPRQNEMPFTRTRMHDFRNQRCRFGKGLVYSMYTKEGNKELEFFKK